MKMPNVSGKNSFSTATTNTGKGQTGKVQNGSEGQTGKGTIAQGSEGQGPASQGPEGKEPASKGPAGKEPAGKGSAAKNAMVSSGKNLIKGVGDSGPMKVPFRTLLDSQYMEIKRCLCDGLTRIFEESLTSCIDMTHKSLIENVLVDKVSESQPMPFKELHPDVENALDNELTAVMVGILTDPQPQLRIDIRNHFADGCKPRAQTGGSKSTTRKMYRKFGNRVKPLVTNSRKKVQR